MDNLSDVDFSYLLTDWCKDAKVDTQNVYFKINNECERIYIFTPYVGRMVGKVLIDKYKKELEKLLTQRKIERLYGFYFVNVVQSNFWVDYGRRCKR